MNDIDGVDLIDRLARLGDALDVDEAGVADSVFERLDAPAQPPHRGRLVAAAVIALAAGVIAYPDSRAAVARWFGLDGVRIEVDPDLPLRTPPASFVVPGPGDSAVVEIDGREVLVSAVDGRLDQDLIVKLVASTDQITEVEVKGQPALWVSGPRHEVLYVEPGGRVAGQRPAANALLWQEGDVLYRVEGFDTLADALAFADAT